MRQPKAPRSTGSRNWDFPDLNLRYLAIALLLLTDVLSGERINSSPRRRRQDAEDVTTVLLVDSHGRSQFGRFLNVKPDVGVLTSTARTFIQEGVTTEYATQVVGTTLDNGRLYAHLLTKSSRVLYDNDAQTRSPNFEPNSSPKKWHLDQNLPGKGNFVKNTDFVSPNQVDSPFVVFPTSLPLTAFKEESRELSDEELLQEPSNNPRVPFEESQKESRTFSVSSGSTPNSNNNNNVKVFQINAQHRHIDLHQPRSALDSEENDVIRKDELGPSKVREWDNLPTFTVRNEFSPSGFSFLGDLPDFDVNTERSKQTTAAERRAKLLFKGGIPNKQDLKTVTYTGFADFTTTVGDTVIVFTPQTSQVSKATSQIIRPSIRPTSTLNEPPIATRVKTFLNHEPGVVTETVEGHKLTMEKSLPTMVVDSASRTPKQQELPMDKPETPPLTNIKTTSGSTIIFAPDSIEPSESHIPMLSTPSDEDIAKIFASLQAKAAVEATEPLNTPSTIFFEDASTTTSEKSLGGATTIFFDDDESTETSTMIMSTAVLTTTPKAEETKDLSQEEGLSEESESDESLEKQTTENILTTTFKAEITTNDIPLTTTEQEPTTTELEPETTTLNLKENESDDSEECKDGQQIVPTTSYKTLTYLTTFFIPESNGDTSTSIKSNQVVSTEVGKATRLCVTPTSEGISASEITTTESSETTTEQITESQETENTTTELAATTTLTPEDNEEEEDEKEINMTTTESAPSEITTERRHVTESEPETTEMTTENGEEIELLFKTLYTTYTYLTTYFQESTSSVASRKTVITNVITSTLDPSAQPSEDAIAGLINQDFKSKPVTFEDFAEIAPSGVGIGRPTTLPESAVTPNLEDSEAVMFESSKATPALSDKNILNTVNAIKTYYTTYTYFTTIFVDGETEISSRTEVYTNYVTPTTSPEEIAATATVLDQEGVKSKIMALDLGSGNYNHTINRQKSIDNNIENDIFSSTAVASDQSSPSKSATANDSSENDLLDLSEYETISTMVTDVRSSTSRGEKRILDTDKRNVLLDDQIVSESNNESEIIPSPTLLLQTSYTTFTYFTTMYQGTTSSNIVSRLETITNVVTETLTPTHTLSVEDLSLPITYFTTFTYWTTLYKEGTTKVTSREETVSNVVTPTPGDNIVPTAVPEIQATSVVAPIGVESTQIPSLESVNSIIPLDSSEKIEASVEATKGLEGEDDQTTYYTTYTYYTTSYVGNSTILNSRLETVTNVVNKTAELDNAIGRAIGQGILNTLDSGKDIVKEIKPTGLLSTIKSTIDNDGTQTVLSTDVYGTYIDGLYAKVLESTSIIVTSPIESASVAETSAPLSTSTSISASKVEEKLKPTGVVSINQGQIVDADGISTLFYTTKAVGTYIDNLYAQVIESTSSFKVDEEKKAALTETPPAHRTGLVRLIEGSIVHSHTTTVYQSKVLGTVIEGRYAQIIESTSSFIIEPTISPTATQNVQVTPTASISPSPVVIEGSISDSADVDDSTENPEDDDENSTEDSDGRVKSRLTFQSRKRTFTPVIRPFASRAKPTFAPKRKGNKAGSATTITRSDFTPTVTAIPATKSGSRFGGGRKSSSLASAVPSASGSRRFSRPRSSTTGASGGLSSTFVPNRGRSSSRIQPTASVFGSSTRRTGGFRSSAISSAPIRPSSSFNANNRFSRIRPTAAFNANRNANSVTLPSTVSDEENDLTTQVTDDPTNVEENETTTAALETTSTRRNANPLLRFRRPPLSRPTSAPRPTTPKSTGSTAGRSTNGRNARVTTTVPPKTTRATSRANAISSRARPANSLFPRRNLFTTTTTPEPEADEEEQDEQADEIENNGNDDTEFEGTDTNTQTEKVPSPLERKSRANAVQIKPFIRKRAKRQTNFSRFRRPTSRTTPAPVEEEPETEPPRTRSRYTGYTSRGRTTPAPRITPSKPSSRSQFTLRDSSNSRTSNFRRPSTVSSNLRKPTSRPSSRQSSLLRNSNTERTTSNNNNKSRKSSSSSRRRGSTRGKVTDIDSNYVLPGSDGTITVTHQIPTEVTIPVVNGKITEYKNIVTAKLSTEILGPKQYSTTTNPFGKEITVLLSESTGFAANGAQQVTKFTLNESPTTTVIFTPTYIRGRKTSFSHVIPSTVYIVDPIVNTLTPALPQAPLANILLSQLLLGQQQANPLLGLQQPGAVAGTPTTEFKTRTTTYLTTVTSETSTVIPLTFRGKEILTTIIDSSTNVVTATEFITDTVVVTPTPVLQQNQQLNSLLVPLLLQQQQQQQQINPLFQQQQLLQNPAGVINANSNEELFKKALFQDSEQTKQNLALDDEGDINEDYQNVDDATEAAPKKPARANKLSKPKKPPAPETSVITLYVSGRTPGEFSTVLSTVVVGEDNKKKREATYVPVQPSKILDDLVISTLEYVDTYVMPAMGDVVLDHSEPAYNAPTESLESILGDVSKKMVSETPEVVTKPTKPGSMASKKYKLKYEKVGGEKSHGKYIDSNDEYLGAPSTVNLKATSDEEADDFPKNYHRKRVIKKKRKLASTTEANDVAPSRKRVVVTKKRRVKPSTTQDAIVGPTRRVRVKKIKHIVKPSTTLEPFEASTKEYQDDSTDKYEESSSENVIASTEDFSQATLPNLEHNDEEYHEEAIEMYDEVTSQPLPDYEPFFPELSESLDAPILLLKTTILSSTETLTRTTLSSKLRTYTFVVTRVNGDEQIVTSTTEVKPHTKTLTVTDTTTKYTTLTLLDLDATESLLPFIPMTQLNPSSTASPQLESYPARVMEEARYNLATRVMSNGVEVIVAGDKTTLPGEPDVKRVLPSSIYKAVTLKPSTLTNNMMMILPQEASKIESLSSSLYPNQFVTKTCLTTFTYLTTYLENGTTAVSSHEQVVSNVATEERNTGNTGKILPTPAMGITLTQYPNLAVGTFVTTYTYLNTILDGEQPLVVTSRRIVSNTVTAPDDYLSLFQPNDKASAVKDTNTYYSTIALEKTLYEGKVSKVIRTNEVVTQVVITESIPPKGTSVMTSYIALDFDEDDDKTHEYTTTDVVKTYFVTYTYYNTLVDGTATTVSTNVSTSRDIVTEKLFLHPKKKSKPSVINTSPISKDNNKKKNKLESDLANLNIIATKTYLTTFTYFTTMLQEDGEDTSTIISSHSKVVENIVTEIIEPSLLDRKYLHSLKKEIKESGGSTVTKNATLSDGQKIEITVGTKDKDKIKPSKVLPTIEKTRMPDLSPASPVIESSNPNVVTGSTIIFVDEFDDPFAQATTKQSTPSLTKVSKTHSKNALSSLLSSEIVKKSTATTTSKRKNHSKRKTSINAAKPTPTATSSSTWQEKDKQPGNEKEQDKKPAKVVKPVPTASPVSNLLGSINIQALRPVLNAMAGLIQNNLKSKANESAHVKQVTAEPELANEVQNRSPIYIPVGGLADIETAESQNLPALNHWEEEKLEIVSKPSHESPLLNGGIPISPGEVITANSDVIVGKPGRVGPRIPAIPLNHPDLSTALPQDIEGMKPPPAPAKTWPKRQSDQQIDAASHPIIHVPNKDDYVGPPPPAVQKIPVRAQNAVRLNKHEGGREQITIPINEQFYLNTNRPKQRLEIQVQDDGDRYTEDGLIVASPIGSIQNFGLQSSHHEQIVLPEVIERSTGQPLLVNIQPSQVAFVNIPHNRTTALIYGGSTEPHINGQYFDDPSPYPEPEFSAIESFSNGVPKFASVYNGQPNHKAVGGVIKVGTHAINIKPHSIPLDFRQIDIRPSKPNLDYINGVHVDSHVNHHDINVNVPPISFGMVQQGNEFNAHIIKHEGTVSTPERRPLRPYSPPPAHRQSEHSNVEYTPRPANVPRTPLRPYGDHKGNNEHQRPGPGDHHRIHEHARPIDHNLKPLDQKQRPNRPLDIYRYGTKPQEQHVQGQLFHQHASNDFRIPARPNYPQRPTHGHRPVSADQGRPPTVLSGYMSPPFPSPPHNVFLNEQTKLQNVHQKVNQIEPESNEDYISDAGEVIQESNSRPLTPGQVPFEVLKQNASSANVANLPNKPVKNNYNHIPHENEILAYRPHIKQPRPFDNPIVRPENQQSNQINHQESNMIVQSGSPNVYANVFTNDNNAGLPKVNQRQPANTHNSPVYVSSTTERNEYLNRINQRYTLIPRVTSLPIDHNQGINTNTFHPNVHFQHTPTSQTEEPYKKPTLDTKPSGVFVFDSHDIPNRRRTTSPTTSTTSTTTSPTTTTKKVVINQDGLQLNIGEIQKINSDFNTLLPQQTFVHGVANITRVAKPEEPIVGLEAPAKMPDVELNPPKIQTVRIPPTLPSLTVHTTNTPVNEIVMGMNPPPRIQPPSHIPATHQLPPAAPTAATITYQNTSYKPTYSMEIDVPKSSITRATTKPPTYIFELPPTTPSTRLRKPATRRPGHRKTTTTSGQQLVRDTTTADSYSISAAGSNYHYGANRINYFDINRHRKPTPPATTLTTEKAATTNLGTVPMSSSKYFEIRRKTHAPDTTANTNSPVSEVTPQIVTESHANDLESQETGIPIDSEVQDHTLPLPTGTVESVELEFTRQVPATLAPHQTHHAGNEVKIIDPTPSSHRRRIVTSIFKRPINRNNATSILLPTRYVTHTKTSTVTITKTTIINSQDGPPSTMTILVTKTEKLTIVDTVTEVHTLVRPTTIAETVTVSPTTVLHTTGISEETGYHDEYQIIPTLVHSSEIEPTIVIDGINTDTIDDGLEDFIIDDHDIEDDLHVATNNKQANNEPEQDGDTFFVVMNDKNQGSVIKIPKQTLPSVNVKEDTNRETQQRDEMINTNEVNRVLLGGILIQPPPSLEILPDKCAPECKPSRNELCQRVDGLMRCLCRPGFARMFPDRPCKPTYTYTLKIGLERHGNNHLSFNDSLSNDTTAAFTKLARVTHDGLDRLLMQSDLRDIYHGVAIQSFQPIEEETHGVYNTFNLQLSDNTDETRLKDVFKKYLRNNNYSLGGTELYASRGVLERLDADDFNECSDVQYHDCSEFAQCFNLRGTYTCSCKEGYADLSENILYPGRICSAELVGCAQCHYHGTCYTRSDDKILCECFQWYAGENCQVNLKVLLIGLVTLGAILFTLLLICIIVTCARRKPPHAAPGSGMAFLPAPRRGTIDRRAMIQDTSSESGSDTLPYVVKKANRKVSKSNASRSKDDREPTIVYPDQKDRSLTVMIPRAKYHPAPNAQYGGSSNNLTTFDKRKNSAASSNEAKLLSYLDAGPSPSKGDQRKISKNSELCYREGPNSRKTSGALVSAGFEVSATVGVNNMGTLATIATTCGTEADRSENATLIQKISADRRSSTGTHSQFNTMGKSIADTADTDDDVVENWLDITPRIHNNFRTISESRSYDETTIQVPMKSFKQDYDTKSSQHNHDEANTMAERDLGSTFLLPHTHLYKPDRGSDISGFESL